MTRISSFEYLVSSKIKTKSKLQSSKYEKEAGFFPLFTFLYEVIFEPKSSNRKSLYNLKQFGELHFNFQCYFQSVGRRAVVLGESLVFYSSRLLSISWNFDLQIIFSQYNVATRATSLIEKSLRCLYWTRKNFAPEQKSNSGANWQPWRPKSLFSFNPDSLLQKSRWRGS